MLSNVIDKIASLLSKSVLIGSFFPILVITFINGVLLYTASGAFHDWIRSREPATDLPTLFNTGAVLIGLVVVAYLFSSLNVPLRELLEGRYWPSAAKDYFGARESRRFREIEHRLRAARGELHRMIKATDDWVAKLREARIVGHAAAANMYGGSRRVGALREKRASGKRLPYEELAAAKDELVQALRSNNVRMRDNASLLDTDHVTFVELLQYARNRLESEVVTLTDQKQLGFGDTEIAPTRIGNVANALRTYGLTRYGLSMDIVWGRLQKVVQKEEYYKIIQDAKTQLDTVIALFWLSAVTTTIWLFVLTFTTYSIPQFLFVAVGGPLVCWAFLFLALTSYRGFAELLRSAVDLYRFDLISELHLPLPEGPASERALWEMLTQHAAYGERPDIAFVHRKSP